MLNIKHNGFLVSDDIQGIKGFRGDLEQPWVFDVWEHEQKYTLYAKRIQHKAEKEDKQTVPLLALHMKKIVKGSNG